MPFEAFDTPFSELDRLGCRDLRWGQRLILDVFEYKESGPAEDIEIAGEKEAGVQTIGFTEWSRIWRLTFERPLAVRVRDESIKFFEPQNNAKLELPSRYCFAETSPWLSELFPDVPDPSLGRLTPIHYIFDLLDDFIEVIADDSPTIERIENDVA